MYLYAGTPPESLTLEITFKHDLTILYRDQSLHSVSYTTQNGGSEVFYFGSKRFRVPTLYDPGRHMYDEHSHCIECDGMIGLGKDSFFWKMWPDASFTASSIVAGGLNPLMETGAGCKGCVVHCDPDGSDSSVCLCEGAITNIGDSLKITYPVRISMDSPVVYLPIELYDRYMTGKNLYDDDVSDWPTIEITIPRANGIDSDSKSHMIGRGIDVPNCRGEMKVRIDPDDLFRTFEVDGRVLLMRPNSDINDRSITLGNSIWNQIIMYRSACGRYMFVQEHAVHDHLSVGTLILFAILFWYLIRWKMTVIALDVERALHKRDNWLNMLYELTAPPLALVALVLPIARGILEDFPVLYAISIAIFVTASIVEIAIFIATFVRGGWKKASSETLFGINYMRNLSHETILMVALWVLVVGRRTEGVATILTVVINLYNLYNISYHLFLFFVYIWYVVMTEEQQQPGPSPYRGGWIFIVIGVVLLMGFQLFATYNYFTAPLLTRNAQIYEELIVPILIVVLIFTLDVALYMVSLYITRGVRLYVAKILKRSSTSGKMVYLELDKTH